MSVVVNLNTHRGKGTLRAVRELLVLAAKGKIVGLRFDMELIDGTRRVGSTGSFSVPPVSHDATAIISLPVRQSGT